MLHNYGYWIIVVADFRPASRVVRISIPNRRVTGSCYTVQRYYNLKPWMKSTYYSVVFLQLQDDVSMVVEYVV